MKLCSGYSSNLLTDKSPWTWRGMLVVCPLFMARYSPISVTSFGQRQDHNCFLDNAEDQTSCDCQASILLLNVIQVLCNMTISHGSWCANEIQWCDGLQEVTVYVNFPLEEGKVRICKWSKGLRRWYSRRGKGIRWEVTSINLKGLNFWEGRKG